MLSKKRDIRTVVIMDKLLERPGCFAIQTEPFSWEIYTFSSRPVLKEVNLHSWAGSHKEISGECKCWLHEKTASWVLKSTTFRLFKLGLNNIMLDRYKYKFSDDLISMLCCIRNERN